VLAGQALARDGSLVADLEARRIDPYRVAATLVLGAATAGEG
jgi:hypothetical protein